MENMNYLETKNLSYRYTDSSFIIKDLSFSLGKNEVMAILGSTGSGKSTLLRILSGLEKIKQGEVVLESSVVASESTHFTPLERKCTMMFQNFALFPHLTVKENILYGVTDKTKRKKVLSEMTEIFQLYDLLDKKPQSLSGGQQQKTAFARCLAVYPKLAFLDEPFSHLDNLSKNKLFKTLRDFFNTYNITGIYSTHSLEDAKCFSDQVAFLKKGRFEYLGSQTDFLKNSFFSM